MKLLILALAALATVATAQTTTVSTNLGLTVVGNADGSATITVGTGPSITIPAGSVTAAQAIIGLLNTIANGVSAGSSTVLSLPVSVDTTTGVVSVTFGGNTYTLDQATFANVMALQGQLTQAIKGILPAVRPTRGPVVIRGHHEGRHHRG